jgi:hypothetical protein
VNAPARLIPDALILLGLTAVALGAGLIYLPAGLVVGGAAAVGLGWVLNLDQAAAPPAETDAPPAPEPTVDGNERFAVERSL